MTIVLWCNVKDYSMLCNEIYWVYSCAWPYEYCCPFWYMIYRYVYDVHDGPSSMYDEIPHWSIDEDSSGGLCLWLCNVQVELGWDMSMFTDSFEFVWSCMGFTGSQVICQACYGSRRPYADLDPSAGNGPDFRAVTEWYQSSLGSYGRT